MERFDRVDALYLPASFLDPFHFYNIKELYLENPECWSVSVYDKETKQFLLLPLENYYPGIFIENGWFNIERNDQEGVENADRINNQ